MDKYVVYVSQVGFVMEVCDAELKLWFPPDDPTHWTPAPGFLSHTKVFESASEAIHYRNQVQRKLDDSIKPDAGFLPDFSKPRWVLRANLTQVVPQT